jgi:sugar-specific transcriptional regulator TrmB
MALEIELKKIGFSDKEAKVYLALLELGEDSVQNIGKKAKVNRATTYVILESLKKQGAVSTIEKGKKTLFVAENPTSLLRLLATEQDSLDNKEKDFRKILPELDAVFNITAERPRVRFFEGKEGMIPHLNDILTSGAKELLGVYPLDETRNIISDKESNYFFTERTKRNISIRAIYTSAKGPKNSFETPGERRFVPKDKFPFSADITIYANRVSMTALRGKHITAIIENKEIADTMRLLFELAWRGAKK